MQRMQQLCVDSQIALEKQARGASLSPAESTLLEDHKPDCAVCCAFALTLEETDKVMHALLATLRKEVDLTGLGERAHASIRKQKRGMVRGLIGLAGFTGLCVGLYARTGDPEMLWAGLTMLGIGTWFIIADLTRLKLTRRWAEKAPVLDQSAARRERKVALAKLAGFVLLSFAPLPLPGTIGTVLSAGLELVGYMGVFHYVFVVRALGAEIKALRD
jgi:hypothetical protein